MPLIGSIPLHPDLAAGGDAGTARGLAARDGELGAVFAELARVVAEEVAPLVETRGVLGPPDRAGRGCGGARAKPTGRLKAAAGVAPLELDERAGPAGLDGVRRPGGVERHGPALLAQARRWAHRENRATGSCCSVTSP